jgi:hypothetical protein
MSRSHGERIPPHDLQRRLDENPHNRMQVYKDFFAEREKAGDIEGAAYTMLLRQLEIERDAAIKERDNMPWKHISCLLILITIALLAFGLASISGGIWLVYLKSEGQTEFVLFGQTFKSGNVGVAAIFIGGVILFLGVRNVLKTIRHTTTTLHKN